MEYPKTQGARKFFGVVKSKKDCGALLILLDLEDPQGLPEFQKCAVSLAYSLSKRVKSTSPLFPVAVSIACCDYESWFLDSLHTLAGKHGLRKNIAYKSQAEQECHAKEWLSRHMEGNSRYFPSYHQAKMTSDLDLGVLHRKSRSFRRLRHAVEELLTALQSGDIITTP